jgi:hypothetical protein
VADFGTAVATAVPPPAAATAGLALVGGLGLKHRRNRQLA